jgi:GAF domain-containing protein
MTINLSEPTHDFFPFVCRLDFTPVLEFWETLVRDERGIDAASAAAMRSQMESVEALLGPIDDLEIVGRNMPIVRRLMSILMPPAFWDTSFTAAFVPFRYQSFLATPRFKTLMLIAQRTTGPFFGLDTVVEEHKITLGGYLTVAAHFYGLRFDFEDPMIATVPDPTTGLKRYFRLDSDNRFIRPVLIGDLPPLSDEQIRELRENVTDVELWRRSLSHGTFAFHGVGLVSAVDITDQEILSRLKHSLIEGDAGTAHRRFIEVQQRIRELLRRPDIVILDDEGDPILDILEDESKSDAESLSNIAGFAERHAPMDLGETIVTRALLTGRIQVIEDLATLNAPAVMEQRVLAKGLRSLLVIPLLYDRQAIGTVNLASPNPSDLTVLSEIALREVAPLFAMALRRSREEMNHRTQAIIRERYTAIHPAIEWRFRRAANRMMLEESRGKSPDVEEIIFSDVYPLYSVSDLRGSSHLRNAAIRADLQEHLRLALEVVRAAIASRPRLVLEHNSFRIERAMKRLDDGIDSGDEWTILDFLRREIEPWFDRLGQMDAEVNEQVIRYRAALDPGLGIIYQRRKEFEQSVAAINHVIAGFLDQEQEKAQAMFPHYFEKHQSDGVDFGIYVGASLVEDGRFDLLYLKDLRLWQLLTMCGIARRAAAMKSSLRVPLDIVHLILVQNVPLSIRFRLDEKQFDVDGAYNVRYEIMKKRIDKALIKGTSERLTQPETIAIVYSNASEAVEYGEYIEYLQSTGYLQPAVESLELEDLQEVQGLKALRVRVKPDVD